MADRNRRFFIRRSYYYESHDSNGKFTGESINDWKDRIIKELSPDAIKALSVALIFHDKDDYILADPDRIHCHAVIHFREGVSLPSARKLTKTGDDKGTNQYCCVAGKPAEAYRYLLHATEKAISEHKRIYGEDELILMSLDNSFTNEKFREYMTSAKSRNAKKIKPATDYINQIRSGKLSLDEVKEAYIKANLYSEYQKNERKFKNAADDLAQTKVFDRKLIAIQSDTITNRKKVEKALLQLFKGNKLLASSLPCDIGNKYTLKDFCTVFDPDSPQNIKNEIYNNCYASDCVIMPCTHTLEDLILDIVGDNIPCAKGEAINRTRHCFQYLIYTNNDTISLFRITEINYVRHYDLDSVIDTLKKYAFLEFSDDEKGKLSCIPFEWKYNKHFNDISILIEDLKKEKINELKMEAKCSLARILSNNKENFQKNYYSNPRLKQEEYSKKLEEYLSERKEEIIPQLNEKLKEDIHNLSISKLSSTEYSLLFNQPYELVTTISFDDIDKLLNYIS